jgi:hypothetical protein
MIKAVATNQGEKEAGFELFASAQHADSHPAGGPTQSIGVGPELIASVMQSGRQVQCIGGLESVVCPQATGASEDSVVAREPMLGRQEVL